ncbi:EboA domain-containing protein [Flavimarina sp. Hel_I_48]|uniref:EboA domain-containing protein n=1 Tax=Flavimarina sp. Hel_I_48 TaxID=1392488 RepID=UPI00068F2792|nr:EboA domain-containing protein [Flavimarina sp. Hel_I_48]
MKPQQIIDKLEYYTQHSLEKESQGWLEEKIDQIITEESVRAFFLTYTLLAEKVSAAPVSITGETEMELYLKNQKVNALEIARIYFLNKILSAKQEVFVPQVSKIIQIADTSELETFLKYLILLPNPESFKMVAVDALRTNIASVFDALALHNPYPAKYFEDKQWNQMFLKAAFMQRPLEKIVSVDERANADLTRIISDYAHERWAAGRDIDPYFWRPVSGFMNEVLLADMQRLFMNENPAVQKAAALCCHYSQNEEAKKLLANSPELYQLVENNTLNWNTLYN